MAVFFVKIMKRFRLKPALYNTMSIVELPRSTVNLKMHVSLGTMLLCQALTIQIFMQGLLRPCSAINTVPGEDDHSARSGRYESS